MSHQIGSFAYTALSEKTVRSLIYDKLHRILLLVLSCLLCNCCWLTVCIVIVVLCVLSYVYLLYCVSVAVFFFNLVAGLLARSQYSECPVTGHLDTGFSWFPCA